jgi:hypothetical protein
MSDAETSQRDSTVPGHPSGLPPEAHNDDQDPHGEQAQDVAEDARREDSRTSSPLESTKPDTDEYDPAPDSKPDLIDEMRRMEGEGRIDMSAFAGEPNHDDEPETYGGETTDDDDSDAEAEWLVADGEDLAEEVDLLDSEGLLEEVALLEEAEARDDDDVVRSTLPDDEED